LPDRLQSLHGNLLTNLNGGVLANRFDGSLLDELRNLVDGVDGVADAASDALLNRTPYSGYEAGAGGYQDGAQWDADNGYAPNATGQLTATDPDGASATFAVDDGAGNFGTTSTGTYGTLTVNPDGSWTYVLDDADADTQALAKDETVQDTFTVQVTDDKGGTGTETLTITITGANDAPLIEGNLGIAGADMNAGDLEPSGALLAKLTTSLSGLTTDGDTLPQVLAQVTNDLGGNTAQAIAVVWDYLDDNYVASGPGHLQVNKAFTHLGIAYADYLKEGGTPLTGIVAKFTADDGDANSTAERFQNMHDNLLGNVTDAALIQRYLNPSNPDSVNDPDLYNGFKAAIEAINAALLDRPYYDGNEGKPNDSHAWDLAHGIVPAAVGQLTATDVDGDTLTWSLPGDPGGTATGAYGSFTVDPATGKWTYTIDPSSPAYQALGQGETAVASVEVAVSDGNGGIDTIVVNVSATGTNDAPVDLALSGTVIPAGATHPFTIGTLTVTDPDDADGFSFTVADADGNPVSDLQVVHTG